MIKDEEISIVVVEALGAVGKDGIVEVRQGGNGNPYQIEYLPKQLPDNMTKKQAKEQKEEIIRNLSQIENATEDELLKAEEEMFRLASEHAVIWINLSRQHEYEMKRDAFMNAFNSFEEIIGRKPVEQ